jgi:hypothetical protein
MLAVTSFLDSHSPSRHIVWGLPQLAGTYGYDLPGYMSRPLPGVRVRSTARAGSPSLRCPVCTSASGGPAMPHAVEDFEEDYRLRLKIYTDEKALGFKCITPRETHRRLVCEEDPSRIMPERISVRQFAQ